MGDGLQESQRTCLLHGEKVLHGKAQQSHAKLGVLSLVCFRDFPQGADRDLCV